MSMPIEIYEPNRVRVLAVLSSYRSHDVHPREILTQWSDRSNRKTSCSFAHTKLAPAPRVDLEVIAFGLTLLAAIVVTALQVKEGDRDVALLSFVIALGAGFAVVGRLMEIARRS